MYKHDIMLMIEQIHYLVLYIVDSLLFVLFEHFVN